MILDSNSGKPEIEYPCQWGYKVIGSDIDKILSAIEQASLGLNHDVTPSNVSKNGKYYSINFTVEVPNETVRNLVYEKLEGSSGVIMVL